LPYRFPDTHKGQQGRILVIGGGPGMSGAAYLAGEAALRIGAGLVTLVQPEPDVSKPIFEIIVQVHKHRREMSGAIQAADVITIGPGLGSGDWAREMFASAVDQYKGRRLLVDAEGLTLLAMEPIPLHGAVLTPHPGEAARLLGCTTRDIQADRFSAVRSIAKKYQAVCVLKGAGTLVSDGEVVYLCDRGHPGMATAGAGDVLSGMVAGLMGQGLSSMDAACAGVWLHAVAGERAALSTGLGMIATDITKNIPETLLQVSV
jgi:NAD(P)H-hydrate epimerase